MTSGRTLQAGEPRTLFQMPPGTVIAATNGRNFLLPVPTQRSARVPFTVVLNWPELIKSDRLCAFRRRNMQRP
jgi:hypothetical protein